MLLVINVFGLYVDFGCCLVWSIIVQYTMCLCLKVELNWAKLNMIASVLNISATL